MEDDPQLRKFLNTMLSKQGYTVIEAGDGVEAEEIFTNYRDQIDLLFIDLVMPRRGGHEFVDRIKGSCQDMKVLYMTD